MSTIIIAAIIICSIIAVCLLLVSIHNKEKRIEMNNIPKYFNQLGRENGLSFSSNEFLKNSILGLDGLNRKILVVTKEDGYYGSFLIDLNQVKNCTVKKIFGTINGGDLKSQKLEQFLQKIILHFEVYNKPTLEIVFYTHLENHIYESLELEKKARHWEAILSKMRTPMQNTALL
jgi:hypothetical protein